MWLSFLNTGRKLSTVAPSVSNPDKRIQKKWPGPAPAPPVQHAFMALDQCDYRITTIVVWALRIAKYTAVYPGTIRYCEKTRSYVLRNRLFQQVITYSATAYFCYFVTSMIFQRPSMESRTTPIEMLELGTWVLGTVSIICATSSIRKLTTVINQFMRMEEMLWLNGFVPVSSIFSKYIPCTVTSTAILIHVYAHTHDHNCYLAGTWCNPSTVGGYLEARCNGATSCEVLSVVNNSYFQNATFLEASEKVVCGLWTIFFDFFAVSSEIICIAIGSSMTLAACIIVFTFRRGLDQEPHKFCPNSVLDILEGIYNLFRYLDNAQGWIIFYVTFFSIPFYASHFHHIFDGGWTSRVVYVSFMYQFITISVWGSLCHVWLKDVPTWYRIWKSEPTNNPRFSNKASTDSSEIDRRFDLLMHELNIKEIGVRGKIFTVTFSAFGQMVALIITYTALWYQIKG